MKSRNVASILAVLCLVVLLAMACGGCSDGHSHSSSGGAVPASSGPALQASGTVNSSGGTIEVTDPESPIKGTKVVVPANAVTSGDGNVTISISYQDSAPASTPSESGALAVSKTILLTKDIKYNFLLPVSVTIPYSDAALDNGAMVTVLYWNAAYNMYEPAGVKAIDTQNKTITFTTIHFSPFTAFGIPNMLPGLPNVDTGFRPDADGFFHPNFGSYDSPGGSCLGMANYSGWYYSVKKKADGQGLYSKYRQGDANNWLDDTNVRELISRAYLGSSQIWGNLWWLLDYALGDNMTAGLLVTNMMVTKSPQTLIFKGLSLSGNPVWGHAVLVYRYQNGKFYIYDNNYPGEEITLGWDSVSGFHGYSKDYGYTINYGFEARLSSAEAEDFENLYEGVQDGWSSSKFKTISVTSPLADPNGTIITPNPNNLVITGTVTGGVKDAKYIVSRLNGQSRTVTQVGADGTFSLTLASLPNPTNSLMLVATDDQRDPFNAYAGFKEVTIKVQGQEFFANSGFEAGDFTGWSHETHTWANSTPGSFTPEKSAIVTPGTDPISGMQKVYKGQSACMVNNEDPNYHISSVSQTTVVPQNMTSPELRFYWAAVLEDPAHDAPNQPYVDITVMDDQTGDVIYSRHFYSNDPTYSGWQTVTFNNSTWRIIPWQTVIVDVSEHRGNSITLRVVAADCGYGGHGGYVYLDGDE